MNTAESKSSNRFRTVLRKGLIILLSPFILFGLIVFGGHATARLPGADTTMYVVYVGATYVVVESGLLSIEQRDALGLEENDILLLGPSFLNNEKSILKVVNFDLRRELRGTKSVQIMEVRLVEKQPMSAFRWTGPEYRDEEVFLIDGERRIFKNALVVWTGTFNFSAGKPGNTPARGAHAPRAVSLSRGCQITPHISHVQGLAL